MNATDPTLISIRYSAVTFFLIVCSLSYFRPRWVKTADTTGRATLSTFLVACYSLTFSLVVAVGVLLLMSPPDQQKAEESLGFSIDPNLIAKAYCSK